ncbi:MAG: histidine triad protein [Bacteroidetes bacterium]|jgi:histidine triad (HIT) family protein|nr:histidine triad protein [Bacteroidota bacterium]MDF2451799.1 histidine triad protein [Bacteroidota bacterium]
MPSIFSKIINGDIPCYKIAESEQFIAFLDAFPLKKGHVLVVPKKEVDYIFDLENDTYIGLMAFAKQVAIALRKAVPCNRIAVSVIGLEVPHAHVHLIPMNTTNDANFANEKLKLTQGEFEAIADQIKKHLPSL